MPYDDHGHGSHVAGIILGNGYDSHGRQSGMAPDASLVVAQGARHRRQGHDQHDHRGARLGGRQRRAPTTSASSTFRSAPRVTESYWIDPLTLAAKPPRRAGIVVVAAAGNLGQNADGEQAVRRHPRARQRAVGADRRRVEHRRHDTRRRTTSSPASVRSVRPAATTWPSPISSRRAAAFSRWRSRAARSIEANAQYLVDGNVEHRLSAVSEPERHEHGGAAGVRRGRADARRRTRASRPIS